MMANEELKQRQSVMWANGPYERVSDTLTDIHELVIERLGPRSGERWLDLACGTGALSELAAAAGAEVVGIDLSPGLIETARGLAAEHGLTIDYRVGDCENLEGVDDASFDVLSSTVGVMFAPDHEATAGEIARVVKPGGRIGLANWTPESGVGDLFRVMGPFQAAKPPSSPFDWGNESRVRELLGDAFELEIATHDSPLELESGEAYWDLFVTSYGPTKTLAESLDEEKREQLHQAWLALFGAGPVAHHREYILVTGSRR
jgi:SAM-dependent methyltransferase